MKNKKFAINTIVVVAIAGVMVLLTGCDPQKIGGGGLMQSYSALNGRYN